MSSPRPIAAPFLNSGETVVLFDGVCKLCNGSARFIIEHDHQQGIKLATVQSPEGQALLAWAALPLDHFDTMAVIRDNHLFLRSDGFLAIVGDFSAPWRWLRLARFIPRSWRDWVYDRIARNRYRWFGRYDTCLMPSPEHERRFLKAQPDSTIEPR
jgi:predicted DCC family thiol-disulfide oxidoreductase YuxK